MSQTIVDKILFPAPPPSYDSNFPNFWIPYKEDNIPCYIHVNSASYKGIVIYAHGNACDIGLIKEEIGFYSQYFPLIFLTFEYPGYGVSSGIPNETTINNAFERVYDFVINTLKCPSERIFLFGRSIGTGPCTRLASSLSKHYTMLGGLILHSPYLSILDIVKQFGFLGQVGSLFISNRWNNSNVIKDVKCPVLFLHGNEDSLIHSEHSEKLYNLCGSEKKDLKIVNGDHNYFDIEEDILGNILKFVNDEGLDKKDFITLSFKEEMFDATEHMKERSENNRRENLRRIIEDRDSANKFLSIFSKGHNV